MPIAASRTKLQIAADRRAVEARRALGEDLRRLREDAGLPKSAVARVAGIDPTHLYLVEEGRREASAQVLARVAAALGADVSIRLFPTSGPRIRDRFQARMVEAFLRDLPKRWSRSVEVAVHRPVRGVIDAVLGDSSAGRIVTLEAQSELRRLEQQIRWAFAKTEALPSSALWRFLAPDPAHVPVVSQILLLRSTTSTRDLARTFRATLSAAYPAEPADLQRSLSIHRRHARVRGSSGSASTATEPRSCRTTSWRLIWRMMVADQRERRSRAAASSAALAATAVGRSSGGTASRSAAVVTPVSIRMLRAPTARAAAMSVAEPVADHDRLARVAPDRPRRLLEQVRLGLADRDRGHAARRLDRGDDRAGAGPEARSVG